MKLEPNLAIDAAHPTPHYRLAVIYRKLGRTQEAAAEPRIFNERKAASDRAQ